MKIFSGIQPTSQVHIGNYLGAIKQWVELQNKAESIFCIVDLHSLTVTYPVEELQKRIRDVAAVYLAAGINPKESTIFVQSAVKEHCELAWLLSTITPLGDLQRMTQFKDKSKKHKENVNAGLFNYPVLMAADILLYNTDIVPVGIDQKQHVELTREIARRFNNRFGDVLKLPKVMIAKSGAKIMSLTEPEKKMSKSDKEQSYLSVFDSPAEIKKKIGSATTDSDKKIKFDPAKKAGISNLLTIYSLFSKRPIKEIEKQFATKGYKDFKESLAQLLIEKLEPFRTKQKELEAKPEILEKILEQGQQNAQKIASQTMQKVKKSMALTAS